MSPLATIFSVRALGPRKIPVLPSRRECARKATCPELLIAKLLSPTWFKSGPVSFALSSAAEAAKGARGSVIVFDAIDLAVFALRIERFGGRHLSSRDMGSHGSVATFADPENNLFQLHVRPGGPV